MTIQTKLNPGDEAFIIIEGKIEGGKIYSLSTEISKEGAKTRYMIELPKEVIQSHGRSAFAFGNEDKVFKTKEELIASL